VHCTRPEILSDSYLLYLSLRVSSPPDLLARENNNNSPKFS